MAPGGVFSLSGLAQVQLCIIIDILAFSAVGLRFTRQRCMMYQ
jgi:hypothetical protein